MNRLIKFQSVLLAVALSFAACKKQTGPVAPHLPPVKSPPHAHAGADRLLIFPKDSAELHGTGTGDGVIIYYDWKQIGGPTLSTIINSTSANTTITNLVVGTYSYELKVTDDRGLSGKDMMNVQVLDTTGGIPCYGCWDY